MDLPHVGGAVAASWAFKPYGRHGIQFLLLLANNGDELLGVVLDYYFVKLCVLVCFVGFVAAFSTGQHYEGLFSRSYFHGS